MKKLTTIQHTNNIWRDVIKPNDLVSNEIYFAIVKTLRANTVELRAEYIAELINAVVSYERAGTNA
jgi:hypothetical protein